MVLDRTIQRRFVCITDVPTPYRTHLFGALNEALLIRNIGFEVLFMATTVPERFWPYTPETFHFPHRIMPGLHPRHNGITFHFNPGILWSVLTNPPTWALIGGGWHIPTAFGLAFAMSLLRIKSYTLLWAEANRGSMAYTTGVVAGFRRAVMKQVRAFAVPGRIAEETITEVCGIREKPFLPFPNLVDEAVYSGRIRALQRDRHTLREKWRVKDSDLVLLWPARLRERDKGIINFLESVRAMIPERMQCLIAGEGPDRKRIEIWLRDTGCKGIRLLGQQSGDAMLELLALADVLLLPSLADPNPLSVIEALWAGLPVFISNRCGNWPEAVETGKNGWIVDPASPESIQSNFMDLLNRTDQLGAFGAVSSRIAEERFSTPLCIDRFVDALEALTPSTF